LPSALRKKHPLYNGRPVHMQIFIKAEKKFVKKARSIHT